MEEHYNKKRRKDTNPSLQVFQKDETCSKRDGKYLRSKSDFSEKAFGLDERIGG